MLKQIKNVRQSEDIEFIFKLLNDNFDYDEYSVSNLENIIEELKKCSDKFESCNSEDFQKNNSHYKNLKKIITMYK